MSAVYTINFQTSVTTYTAHLHTKDRNFVSVYKDLKPENFYQCQFKPLAGV